MSKLKGADKALSRMRQLNSPSAKKRVSAALFVAADMMRVDAALSISQGAVSGKNHVASKPGEAPNFDTGDLASRIETREIAEFEVEVSSNAAHSAPLEFGTSKMEARPFMAPAAQRMRPKAQRLVAAAISREKGRRA